MSTPTTDTKTWLKEMGRLLDVQTQLCNEMKLLPRTKELMMKYEKLYLRASDNAMRHHHPRMIERLNERREEFKLLHRNRPDVVASAMRGFDEEIQAIEESQPKVYDWDAYFLNRTLYDYHVSGYFREHLNL